MGYRIVYGDDPFEKQGAPKSRLRVMTAGFALALVLMTRLFWPTGTEILRAHLLPGENDALAQLTQELRAGEPIGDAVTAFCRSIVEEAVGEAD